MSFSCSSFVLKNGKTILLGKNFDWTFDQGYVFKNPKHIKKSAYVTHNGIPVSWTSKYGSITFNQNGKDMPYGGMNDKGLVVEMLWLDETRFNVSEQKHYINELEWIQYQLDNFQTIEEVVAQIDQIKIYPIKGKIHYILTDPSGNSVVIEYISGKPKVFENKANICQAITNSSVVNSKKYIDQLEGIQQKNTSDLYRYHKLEKHIANLDKTNEINEKVAFQMLKDVSISKGKFKTVWSIVYNVENKKISFFSHKNKKVKNIDLEKIDFDSNFSGLNINQDQEIVLDTKLKPISIQTNFELVAASLTHLGFDKKLSKDMSDHQFNTIQGTQSYYSENYFHFDISIPMEEAGKLLRLVVMDSEENFKRKVAVNSGYLFGLTAIGTANVHIYGLKNGNYAILALLDDNNNKELDFDLNGNPLEKYSFFSLLKPTSMQEITFQNTSAHFTKANGSVALEWR